MSQMVGDRWRRVGRRRHPASRIPSRFRTACAGAALLACAFSCLFPAPGIACPGCKETLFDPSQLPQKLGAARGYALSIGLLLAVPFALVGGIAAAVIRANRRRPCRSVDTPRLSR